MKKKSIIYSLIILVLLCISSVPKEFQNDTFYTIKIGESILNNGLDMIDHFSIHSLSYTYPHWLYDVLIYKIYDLTNFTGLYILSIILFITLIISIYYITYKINKNEIISLIISIIPILTISSFITARAQSISIILLFYEIYFIEELIKTNKKKYIIYLSIISYLLANIHTAIYPLYYILYLPYIMEYLLTKSKLKIKLNSYNNKIEITKDINIKSIIITIIISIILGFLTPLKLIPFTYTIKTFIGDSMKYIGEHQPLILIKNIDVLILSILVLIILIFTKTKIKLHDLFLLLGLFTMALLSIRHILLLLILGSIPNSRILDSFLKIEKDKSLNTLYQKLNTLPMIILSLIIVSLYSFQIYQNNNKPYINKKEYPIEASEYILDNLDIKNIRLYNDYNYGSYLIYKNIPVFVDSRCDLYLKEFNNTKVFDDYIELPKHYDKTFKKYNISHILIKKSDELNIPLKIDNNYKKIYKDKYFIIYERNDYK